MKQAREYVVSTNKRIAENRFSFFAGEEKENGVLVDFLGLENIKSPFLFAPVVEIGWRLAFLYWRRGYTTEAVKAVLEYRFIANWVLLFLKISAFFSLISN